MADRAVAVRVYRVTAASAAGKSLADIKLRAPRVSIDRIRRAGQWLTPDESEKTTLALGDELVVEAPLAAHVQARDVLGPELADAHARALVSVHTVDVVIDQKAAAGRSLPQLLTDLGPGLYPNAVFRAGVELPAGPETELKMGDVIRVTGNDSRIAMLGRRVGQVVRATHTSDVLTLSIGLLIGAAIGAIPVPLFGLSISFGATAVLVTGIVFGWLRTRHPALGGPLSEGARDLMEGLGLNVFTAVLAINSGQAVFEVMTTGPVWSLVGSCLVISAIPALIAWWVGRHVLKLNPALLMGAIAGARQNTASLRAAQRETQSAVPGIGYPVPLAIATVVLSIAGYMLAIFA